MNENPKFENRNPKRCSGAGVTAAWLALLLVAVPARALAQNVPAAINYQGKLTDSNGDPVASGYYEVEFRVWDHPTQAGAGNYIWGRSFPLHVVTNGLFNVLLSDDAAVVGTPKINDLLQAFGGPNRYLGLTITRNPLGQVASPVEISPRQQLVSAPYAIEAADAASLGGAAAANYPKLAAALRGGVVPALAGGALANSALSAVSTNRIGINNSNPQAELDVTGSAKISDTLDTDLLHTRWLGPQAGIDNGLHFNLLGHGSGDYAVLRVAQTSVGGEWQQDLQLEVGNDATDTLTLDSTGPANLVSENSTATVTGKAVSITASDANQAVNVYGNVSAFGDVQPQTTNVLYTAASDGFCVFSGYHGEGRFVLKNRTGQTLMDNYFWFYVDGADRTFFTMPVAKGESYEWTFVPHDTDTHSPSYRLWWRPLGR